MGTSRRRLTLGRMMAGIGVAALVLALTRVDAAPGVSLCVFAACAWFLAARRYAEAMARRSAEGLTTSRARRARVLAEAAGIAVLAIGLPDAAFLAGYQGYMAAVRATIVVGHGNLDFDPWHMMTGVVLGIIAALYVASVVRRWLGPIAGSKPALPAASHRGPAPSRHLHEEVTIHG